MAESADESFDLSKTTNAFKECIGGEEDKRVIIDEYINSYSELYKFLNMMGSVFSFVASDVHEKLKKLRAFRQSEEKAHYESVESMARYETESGRIEKPANGCRILLRLHRALLFIKRLFEDTAQAKTHDKTSHIAHAAYTDTLAQYHTWLVRKAVGLAVYTLPSRSALLQKMGGTSEDEAVLKVIALVKVVQDVYDHVQGVYVRHDILQLP